MHSDSQQSIDEERQSEGGGEGGRANGRVWGLERIRMGGGEENSVKLLRVRTSGRQGLGPTCALLACCGEGMLGLAWLSGIWRNKEKKRKGPSTTALDCTALDCFLRFLLPSPPTYQLLPDLVASFISRPSEMRPSFVHITCRNVVAFFRCTKR